MIEEKTKEQIIERATKSDVPEPDERYIITMNEALRAMTIWADQEKKKEAIAFHIWVREQGYIRRKGLYYSRYVKGVTLTDEGLYNLYLQYVNQSK